MKIIITTLIFILINIFSFPQTKSGLIAYYPFDGNTTDLSGNNNNGVVIGGVTWTTGVIGNAAHFNGTNAYIKVNNSTSLQSPRNALSMSAWIYLENGHDIVSGIASKTETNNYGQYGFAIHHWSNNSLYVHLREGSGNGTPYNFQNNRWYFVAFTWDGNSIRLFVNGELIGRHQYSKPLIVDSNPLTIGLDGPGNYEYFKGRMDELRIYNRALSQSEVEQLYSTVEN